MPSKGGKRYVNVAPNRTEEFVDDPAGATIFMDKEATALAEKDYARFDMINLKKVRMLLIEDD